jgi:hypothetical protein
MRARIFGAFKNSPRAGSVFFHVLIAAYPLRRVWFYYQTAPHLSGNGPRIGFYSFGGERAGKGIEPRPAGGLKLRDDDAALKFDYACAVL